MCCRSFPVVSTPVFPVSMLMRRGCRVHYCFLNLGGAAHEIGVRQVAHYLRNRFRQLPPRAFCRY
ncbi:hypothetical protein ACLBR5_25390 [Escherichia coli]